MYYGWAYPYSLLIYTLTCGFTVHSERSEFRWSIFFFFSRDALQALPANTHGGCAQYSGRRPFESLRAGRLKKNVRAVQSPAPKNYQQLKSGRHQAASRRLRPEFRAETLNL